jgi:hypothetical protein
MINFMGVISTTFWLGRNIQSVKRFHTPDPIKKRPWWNGRRPSANDSRRWRDKLVRGAPNIVLVGAIF